MFFLISNIFKSNCIHNHNNKKEKKLKVNNYSMFSESQIDKLNLKSEKYFESIETLLDNLREELFFKGNNKRCSALIKNKRSMRFGLQCGKKSGINTFCGLHNKNKSNNDKSFLNQCCGITKKGTQCLRIIRNENYCYQHKK